MKKYTPFIIQNIILILCIILSYFCLSKVLLILAPFAVAFVISRIFNPIVEKIEKIIKKRAIASLFIVFFVIFVIGGLLYGVLFLCISLGSLLFDSFPEIAEETSTLLSSTLDKIENNEIFYRLDFIDLNKIESLINEKMIDLISYVSEKSIDIATASIGYFWPVFLFILFTLLATYFMITQKDQLYLKFASIVGYERTETINTFYKKNIEVLLNFLKAQVKISFFVFFIVFIYLLIFKMKYSILLALVITVVDSLPILGTGTVLCPFAVLCVLSGEYKKAIMYLVLYIITLVFRQAIQPKIISSEIGVDSFMSLILMYAGYVLYGFIGLLISVPLFLILRNLYESGIFNSYLNYIYMIYNDLKNVIKKE